MKFDCIFCKPDRTILAESHLSLAFLDSFPVSRGHALIVPRRHVVSIWDMTDEEYADAFNLVRRIKDELQVKFAPHEFNVGVNCGEAAGQSVCHAHSQYMPQIDSGDACVRCGVRVNKTVAQLT